jgi:N-methylhydantoinase A
VLYSKSPTTYSNFVDGITDCMRKAKVAPDEVRLVNHGTTLVINAIIQRKGSRVALVTTQGFRDVLEIARGNRPDPFDLYYMRDEPLIPRERRHEVAERVGTTGDVVTPLDEAKLAELAALFKAEKIEAVAISFMNAYANPAHEERAVALLRQALPGVYITNGVDLYRGWYEYERTATVAANAYVGPQVAGYVGNLDEALRAAGFPGTLYLMGSNGGVLSAERARRQPSALVESGPIGGCIGAAGSIAWLDEQKRLHVGPQSAGSTPGPVCYGRGGTEPTITDANLLMGRLAPDKFLGGELALDVAATKAAMLEKIAKPLGYNGDDGIVEMADGIISIATVIMAGAIRRQTIEHGRDPRDFVLFAYGGNGALHASALAHELSIPTVVVPPEPGNFSATGMLLANARLDSSQTFVRNLDDAAVGVMAQRFGALEDEATTALKREIGAEDVFFERSAEMRYRGQRHSIKVPLSDFTSAAAIREQFDRDYKRRYGHADQRAGAEIQALHLSAFSRLRRPDLARLYRAPSGGDGARGTRPVHFPVGDKWVNARIYERYDLALGFTGTGPAVIEEYGATTVIWPGDTFEIGELREIRIRCQSDAAE